MKKILFTILVLTFSISTASSQGYKIDEVDLIKKAENNGFTGQLEPYLVNLKRSPGQAAVIKQIGNNNTAIITQYGLNLFAYILQRGNHLDASLTLKGEGNSAVIKQDGSYLTTDVKLTGENNKFKLLQTGSNLSNNIKLLNTVGMDVQFLQTETNFYYSQNGGSGIGLQITTNQADPAIIVRNN